MRDSVWLLKALFSGALALAFLATLPAPGFAQSGIAGVVRDASGAVLPGVTVEAASPALIEKVRVAVTDDSGRYNIVDVRPGVYTVTFSLTGFQAVRRDGIDLPPAFTATVSAELSPGAIQETITVSGAAPVVDVQNVFQQTVLSQELLDALPTARLPQNLALLVPGVTLGAGGYTTGLTNTNNGAVLSVHGNRGGESVQNLDGFPTRNMFGPGGSSFYYYVNSGSTQEVVVLTGSAGAEQQMSGVVTNSILRSGGNRFSFNSYFHYTDERFLSDNLTDALIAQGVTSGSSSRRQWDVNPAFGGPIKRDKVWFYASVRNYESMADSGIRYNLTPHLFTYTPDMSQKTASEEAITQNYAVRLSWQATPRNTFSGYYDWQPRDVLNSTVSPTQSPEASGHAPITENYLWLATWKAPLTNRVLLEAGSSHQAGILNVLPNDKDQRTGKPAWPGVFDAVSSLELNTNLRTRSRQSYNRQPADLTTIRGAVSYVTGSHAFKAGVSHEFGSRSSNQFVNQEYLVSTRGGVPASVTLDASGPFRSEVKADRGLYVQDQWTVGRMSLNLGVRYDYFEGYVPAQEVPANRWVDATRFDEVKGLPKWHDLSPRVGAAYDVFGTGRTALKGGVSRYVRGFGGDLVNSINPVNSRVTSANRTWTDNGDFVPDCNMRNPVANGECGPISNVLFGSNNPNAQRFDPEVLKGFGTRENNWEATVGVNHELRSGISANAGYFRRWYGNAQVIDNVLLAPADHNPYCITAPSDSRLPGGGGQRLCGFYDNTPAKQGQVQNLVTSASNFGDVTEVYDGVDLSVGGRFPGGQVTFGTNTGRTVLNTCAVVDSPGTTPAAGYGAWREEWCERTPPFLTQYKINGFYRLPWWGVQVSGAFQSNPGPEISATTYVATNAEIRDSLGRNLAAGANATVILPIMAPGSEFASNWSKTDIRLSKIFRFGGTSRITGGLDIFNAFNRSGTVLLNTRFGPQWLRPTTIVPARLLRFSAQVDF